MKTIRENRMVEEKRIPEQIIPAHEEEVTMYEADDGTIFDNEEDCLEYEEQSLETAFNALTRSEEMYLEAYIPFATVTEGRFFSVYLDDAKAVDVVYRWLLKHGDFYYSSINKELDRKIKERLKNKLSKLIGKWVLITSPSNDSEDYAFAGDAKKVFRSITKSLLKTIEDKRPRDENGIPMNLEGF